MKKVCSKCKQEKDFSEFHKSKKHKDGLFYSCKGCELMRGKGYYKENKKIINNNHKKYYLKNKDIIKKRHKKYLKENKEKRKILMQNYYQNNKKEMGEKRKIWLNNNPEKIREMSRRRRNLKLNAKGSHTEQEWQDKKKEYNYRCAYCGIHENILQDKYKDKKFWQLHEEHIVALTLGGSDYINNIIPACVSCNSSKHNKLIKNYLVTGGTGFLGQALVKKLLKRGDVGEIRVYARDELKESDMCRRIDNPRVKYILGDVRDIERLRGACNGIDIIIHAAAMKRMDISSYNVFEVADVNIRGTKNVMLAGRDCKKIIFVSTDKAYNPTCVYGASKFIAERIVLAYPNGTVWRFGNFIDSRGSVFEIFKEQRDAGIPLTITDLDSTRFVIDIEEVCDYILSNVKPGIHYPPNLKSMTIMEIAESIAPGHPFKIVGLREGEKLHESFDEHYTSEKKDE
jgi:UDP-N-acetylglucosamine 4,6-dehydratase